jgi:hypothetical protein
MASIPIVLPQGAALAQSHRPAPVQAEDPQSDQLAQMMRALGEQPILSSGGLATDLLADALLQYAYNRRQGRSQSATTPGEGATSSDSSSSPSPPPSGVAA